jgi:hypothetical protein
MKRLMKKFLDRAAHIRGPLCGAEVATALRRRGA